MITDFTSVFKTALVYVMGLLTGCAFVVLTETGHRHHAAFVGFLAFVTFGAVGTVDLLNFVNRGPGDPGGH